MFLCVRGVRASSIISPFLVIYLENTRRNHKNITCITRKLLEQLLLGYAIDRHDRTRTQVLATLRYCPCSSQCDHAWCDEYHEASCYYCSIHGLVRKTADEFEQNRNLFGMSWIFIVLFGTDEQKS